ncbi:MAG: ssb [Akkermansiaceae bacterium]|nr:ssb [Akkermansiaceae bacterium]
MASLNKVLLLGNLTRDPDVRYTPKGTAVGDLGLAVNRRIQDGRGNWTDEATFVDVTVWGATAENAQKFLTKGRSVLVEGRLSVESWTDKQSGQKRSRLKVTAETLQFLPDAKSRETSERARQPGGPGPAHAYTADSLDYPENRSESGPSDYQEEESDIPF